MFLQVMEHTVYEVHSGKDGVQMSKAQILKEF